MKYRLIMMLTLMVISIAGFGQKIIIGGKETTRKLKWADFTGEIDKSSPYFANTRWNLKYRYADVQLKDDAVVIGKFEASLELDPGKSWLKPGKESDELLVHEQGHFNLGILCMKELLTIISRASLNKSNYTGVIQNIFDETINKYKAMGIQYDDETGHGSLKEQQQKWNDIINLQLKR